MPSRRTVLRGIGALGIGNFALQPGLAQASSDPWARADYISARVRRPRFAPRWFDITRFGAVGDGGTDCTAAIRRAINACHRAGGGHVVVPEGLDGQSDLEHWWPWCGAAKFGWQPGEPRQTEARTALSAQAEQGIPVDQRRYGDGGYLRPSFIEPYRCRDVLIEGVTIERSPMWEIHPVLSKNVLVNGVTVRTHGPNNDGCNPESSRLVVIRDCLFDTGDDCIAIKSGRNADGRRVNVPSEDILVEGCTMRAGHGGVTIGSEMTGGARNVFVRDCAMSSPDLDIALRFKTNSVRGGFIEGFHARDLTIGEVGGSVIDINFFYEEGPGHGFNPVVGDIHVQDVTVT
jgi:polygalacturonase